MAGEDDSGLAGKVAIVTGAGARGEGIGSGRHGSPKVHEGLLVLGMSPNIFSGVIEKLHRQRLCGARRNTKYRYSSGPIR